MSDDEKRAGSLSAPQALALAVLGVALWLPVALALWQQWGPPPPPPPEVLPADRREPYIPPDEQNCRRSNFAKVKRCDPSCAPHTGERYDRCIEECAAAMGSPLNWWCWRR